MFYYHWCTVQTWRLFKCKIYVFFAPCIVIKLYNINQRNAHSKASTLLAKFYGSKNLGICTVYVAGTVHRLQGDSKLLRVTAAYWLFLFVRPYWVYIPSMVLKEDSCRKCHQRMLRIFHSSLNNLAFPSVVRQMSGYNSQRRGTARTSRIVLTKYCVYCLL